jgi:hypothetical protein
MNCTSEFQSKNYSVTVLNQAMGDDAGSWWWWVNVIGKNISLIVLLYLR